TTPTVDTAQAPPAASPVPPLFDLVRVEPDGSALISGTVKQGGRLYLALDGARLDKAETDVTSPGDFVIFATIPVTDQPQILSLEQVLATGETIASDQTIIIAARPVAVDTTVADIALTPNTAVGGDNIVDPTQSSVVEDDVHITDVDPDLQTPNTTPTVLLSDGSDVRVLAPPVATVALDTIRYDVAGDVVVGGRAAGSGFVRVYLDNKPIITSPVEQDGHWRSDLPDIATGIYTLRVDELDDTGTVTSRVETPFQRESPDILAKFSEPGSAADMTEMTVQPGTTLWAMAVAKYGDGSQFLKLFDANRNNIKDPNLIYPGQIFDLPD
ncbi:MAG: LysM peptidoglycan-binding domain-containing protein, partial [Pseudomonadota bacterium]